MNNITEHALEVKKSSKYRIIKDNDLKTAAEYALIEVRKWDEAVNVLMEYNNRFDNQICVMALFSVELYLKAILMANGINVTKEKDYGHNIYKLFNRLDDSVQESIKADFKQIDISFTNLIGEEIKLDSFDKVLEFISNDFVALRYHYEKYLNGEPVYGFTGFIIEFRNSVKKCANSKVCS